MANNNHRPVLSNSQIIDLKGRPVGTEDFETAAQRLQWIENENYRGGSLKIAAGVALGLGKAIELSLHGNHEAAAKQAFNIMYVLKKDRENSRRGNYNAVGNLQVACRDGQTRDIGAIVKWFASVHMAMHEQIATAKAKEAEELAASELEALQFAASLADGQALQNATSKVVKAA